MAKDIKSCKQCYCKPVCRHLSKVVQAFREAAHDMTPRLLDVAVDGTSEVLAKECKHFSSIDQQDFKRLEKENEELTEKLRDIKRRL